MKVAAEELFELYLKLYQYVQQLNLPHNKAQTIQHKFHWNISSGFRNERSGLVDVWTHRQILLLQTFSFFVCGLSDILQKRVSFTDIYFQWCHPYEVIFFTSVFSH